MVDCDETTESLSHVFETENLTHAPVTCRFRASGKLSMFLRRGGPSREPDQQALGCHRDQTNQMSSVNESADGRKVSR